MAARCSFCSATSGPFTKVEGLFTVLMCADCQAARGHGSGPHSGPDPCRDARRSGPAANLGPGAQGRRQPPVIATMRTPLAAGEAVARMYQEPGLAWLERQAQVAEELVAQRKRSAENRPGS